MVKKQPKRRAWRKAEISDVEEALEDERLVAKLKTKAKKGQNDFEGGELFSVDTKGTGEGLSGKTRRELARAKLFPPKGPKLGLSAAEEAKVDETMGALAARGKAAKPSGPDVYDLWAAPAPHVLAKQAAKVEGFRIRKLAKPIPLTIPKTLHQKVGSGPAVLLAHEGQSVNPDTTALEELTCLAAAKQLEKEEEADAHARQLRPMTRELLDNLGADAVRGLSDAEKIQKYRDLVCQSGEVGNEEGGEAIERKAVKNKQKSQAQRNKEKKRKVVDSKQAQLQAQKKLEKSVGQIGAILKEMKQEEEWQEERRKYRQDLKRQRKEHERVDGIVPKRRRFGRGTVVEEEIVVPDVDSSTGGLRGMSLKGSAGSAVKDRLASILRRGLLPAPPEAHRGEVVRRKAALGKLKRRRKPMSPLLRDNLLLR